MQLVRPPFLMRGSAGGGVAGPSITVGPTPTDNGDGTANIAVTISSAIQLGIDYGASTGVYTESAFSYSTPPTLLTDTVHDPLIPDALDVGAESFGHWFGRVYDITNTAYIGSEFTFDIAAVLSAAADGTPTATGATDAQVTTNADSGTLYWCLVTNGGSATAAQIIAGTGGNIVAGTADSQAVTVSGVQTFDVTGAAASTLYQIKTLHVVQGANSNQGSVSLTTASSGPGAFPEVDFGPDGFTGTSGNNLSTYNATNYASVPTATELIITATQNGARGNADVGRNEILTAPTADHVDVVTGAEVGYGSDGVNAGVVFLCSDSGSATTNGYYLCVYRIGAGNRVGRLYKWTSGAIDGAALDETTGLDVSTGDRVGVRWNDDGTWQMYKSDSGGAWATTGTPGTDTTYTAAGGAQIYTSGSGGNITAISIGTW